MALSDELSQMQGAWENVAKVTPDGTHQALVDEFEFFEGRDGTHYLKTVFEIQNDPEFAGAREETIHSINVPDRLEWLFQHLQGMGLELEQLADLESRLNELKDTPVELYIQTKDKDGTTYRNVYVNKRLGPPIRGQAASEIPADTDGLEEEARKKGSKDDDKIPF